MPASANKTQKFVKIALQGTNESCAAKNNYNCKGNEKSDSAEKCGGIVKEEKM